MVDRGVDSRIAGDNGTGGFGVGRVTTCARVPVSASAVLDVEEITVRFGGIMALDRASFSIEQGEICGLIGPERRRQDDDVQRHQPDLRPDSSGRSTSTGKDLLRSRPHRISELGIFRTFQNLALWPGLTVLENVMVGAHSNTKANFVTAPLRLGTRGEERKTAVRCFELLQRLGLGEIAFQPAAGLPFGTLEAGRDRPGPRR